MDNYKQKYNAALERAKERYSACSAPALLEYIFPELKENESERIRKDIISYLRNEKVVKRYISDIEVDKWIAWLEKQGHMLDADKVIEWFRVNWWDSHIGNPIEKFKKDFGL